MVVKATIRNKEQIIYLTTASLCGKVKEQYDKIS